jgi:hypothetical protein
MDKDELKILMLDFLNKLEADGYNIDFAGLIPWLPEYDEPYKLQIYSAQFSETGIMSAISMLVRRLHEQFSPEIRRHINGFDVCRKPEDIACRKEDILINKIKYRGLSIPYRMLLDYA